MVEYTLPNNGALLPVVNTDGGKAQMTMADVAFNQWVRSTNAQREKQYRVYRDYYDGDHPTMLTKRLQEFLENTNNTLSFKANYMAIPVDIMAERMRVTGFKVIGEPDDAQVKQGGEGGLLWQWWVANAMDEEQGDVHMSAFRDGDTYVLVDWDNDREIPRYNHNFAFDGNSGVTVVYDEADKRKIKVASKQWRVETGDNAGNLRRNLYYDNRVEKYMTGSGGWVLFDVEFWTDSIDPATGRPLENGNPLGVPVFHFRNRGGGYDYGVSELKDLIPVQDLANKTIIDIVASADSHGFPMAVYDKEGADGIPDGVKFGPGGVLWGGKWYHLEPGDLSQLLTVFEKSIMIMAQISRTPLQYYQVTGQVASDDTQRAGDTGLVSKIERAAVSFGNNWEQISAYGRKLHNVFGGGNLEEYPLLTEWASFERVNQQESSRVDAETQEIKERTFSALQTFFPMGDRKEIALLAGYTVAEAEVIASLDTSVIGIDL